MAGRPRRGGAAMRRKRHDPKKEMDLAPFGIKAKIPVVDDDEAESCDFVVCAPKGPSPFKDNFTGNCCICGIEIMYRWHAPRRPKKICIECAAKQVGKEKLKEQK